MVSKVFV
jgi:hypothetical protein